MKGAPDPAIKRRTAAGEQTMAQRKQTPKTAATLRTSADILAALGAAREARLAEKRTGGARSDRYQKPHIPGNDDVQILGDVYRVRVHVPFSYQDENGREIRGRDAYKDPRVAGGEYKRTADGTLDISGVNIVAGDAYDPATHGGTMPRTYVPLGTLATGLYHESVADAARFLIERVLKADKGV